MAVNNKKTLDDNFSALLRNAELYLISGLHYAAVELIHRALQNREFTGFTGNTQTSYTCGIYLNGMLKDVVDAQSFQAKPVRKKIREGKSMYLKRPYEGNPRVRNGYVAVDGRYGSETALEFINRYKAPSRGIALVMTTGTEYSEFLEEMFGLDVLTKTYKEAYKVIMKNWKPIP